MAQRTVRQMVIPMLGTLFPADSGGFAGLRCLRCGSALELIQPGQDLPERLLGICEHSCDQCGGWHIINAACGDGKAVIALVPDCAAFRAAYDRAE